MGGHRPPLQRCFRRCYRLRQFHDRIPDRLRRIFNSSIGIKAHRFSNRHVHRPCLRPRVFSRIHLKHSSDVNRHHRNSKPHRHHSNPGPKVLKPAIACASAFWKNQWAETSPHEFGGVFEGATGTCHLLWKRESIVQGSRRQKLNPESPRRSEIVGPHCRCNAFSPDCWKGREHRGCIQITGVVGREQYRRIDTLQVFNSGNRERQPLPECRNRNASLKHSPQSADRKR